MFDCLFCLVSLFVYFVLLGLVLSGLVWFCSVFLLELVVSFVP